MPYLVWILSTLLCFITSKVTFSYFYPIKIGESKTQIQMLLDSSQSKSILFSDFDRPYSDKILPFIINDICSEQIIFNSKTISNLPFVVEDDSTELNNNQLQGVVGLGISLDKKNTIIDKLFDDKAIESKRVFLETSPTPALKFSFNINEKEMLSYESTTCKLTDRDDIDKRYQNSWVCEFTHVFSGENISNVTLNDGLELHGRAVFDTTSSYITAPSVYWDEFKTLFSITKEMCAEGLNDQNETLWICEISEQIVNNFDSLFVLFDGYAYEIKGKDLFRYDNVTDRFYSLIKFRKEINNIWTFGNPFFQHYNISFDYETETVGIAGPENKVLNLSLEWNEWIEENRKFLRRGYNDKTVMIVGATIGCMIWLMTLLLIIRRFCQGSKERMHSKFIEDY